MAYKGLQHSCCTGRSFYLVSEINFYSFSMIVFRIKYPVILLTPGHECSRGLSFIGKEGSCVCACGGAKPCLAGDSISVTAVTCWFLLMSLGLAPEMLQKC